MAKKESTNEKIIRLFKEGVEIEAISKDIGLTTENVKNIIESRIPNYLEYDPGSESRQAYPNGRCRPDRDIARFFLRRWVSWEYREPGRYNCHWQQHYTGNQYTAPGR